MQNKWVRWLCLVLIIVLAWIELQFFTEASNVAEYTRQIAHILFLLAIMGVGYYVWAKSTVKWLKVVWVATYVFVLLLVFGIGALNRVVHFNIDFLDEIHQVRVFFSSPIPFLMTWVLEYLQKQKQ
ncbi:MAG: hypothetical protein EOP51_02425 [Sphingobacteriales bacterium]|nr:MAG: hypothetical protein EOP51_02425 [Sphingobacteriales bacterium]